MGLQHEGPYKAIKYEGNAQLTTNVHSWESSFPTGEESSYLLALVLVIFITITTQNVSSQ